MIKAIVKKMKHLAYTMYVEVVSNFPGKNSRGVRICFLTKSTANPAVFRVNDELAKNDPK